MNSKSFGNLISDNEFLRMSILMKVQLKRKANLLTFISNFFFCLSSPSLFVFHYLLFFPSCSPFIPSFRFFFVNKQTFSSFYIFSLLSFFVKLYFAFSLSEIYLEFRRRISCKMRKSCRFRDVAWPCIAHVSIHVSFGGGYPLASRR